nr:MAG TPA: hypothetical protein [Caudoviricetes sp.]DAG55383.1 MAG TPA: hypothetical protein [Caudoviricetes sp.]DAU09521.1 MAG TPA: hypothetical protein [Caudoviricetes sp.]DAZ79959.1 MAG TPA: hypothetical protein [Caudoviricetes sp.]
MKRSKSKFKLLQMRNKSVTIICLNLSNMQNEESA